jgi:beta-lactamase class C
MMTDSSMEGLAVAVVENGRIAFVHGYGLTRPTRPAGRRPNRLPLGLAVEDGVGDPQRRPGGRRGVLADRSAGDLPHQPAPAGDAQNSLTVEQLLSQRTGLAKNAYDDRLEDGEDPAVIRAALGKLSPVCPPGHLPQLPERRLRHDHRGHREPDRRSLRRETVRSSLFAPLGMTGATIGEAGPDRRSNDWARPHRERRTLPLSPAYYRVPAAAGVNSTIVDLAVWMQAQMGLRPTCCRRRCWTRSRRRAWRRPPLWPLPIARALSHAGYGLGMRSFTYKGHRLVGHSGGSRATARP